ncbi:MAG: hypothetical protein JST00_06505 [Deltaproteobacteria bacterium]|nr:hypothetical protein [Deltaproteobacteria bacterium]
MTCRPSDSRPRVDPIAFLRMDSQLTAEAVELMKQGAPDEAVAQRLVQRGVDPDEAAAKVMELARLRRHASGANPGRIRAEVVFLLRRNLSLEGAVRYAAARSGVHAEQIRGDIAVLASATPRSPPAPIDPRLVRAEVGELMQLGVAPAALMAYLTSLGFDEASAEGQVADLEADLEALSHHARRRLAAAAANALPAEKRPVVCQRCGASVPRSATYYDSLGNICCPT